jgi:hypothetical protein
MLVGLPRDRARPTVDDERELLTGVEGVLFLREPTGDA